MRHFFKIYHFDFGDGKPGCSVRAFSPLLTKGPFAVECKRCIAMLRLRRMITHEL